MAVCGREGGASGGPPEGLHWIDWIERRTLSVGLCWDSVRGGGAYSHLHTYIHLHTPTYTYIHTYTPIHTYTHLHLYCCIQTRATCKPKNIIIIIIITYTYIHLYTPTHITHCYCLIHKSLHTYLLSSIQTLNAPFYPHISGHTIFSDTHPTEQPSLSLAPTHSNNPLSDTHPPIRTSYPPTY